MCTGHLSGATLTYLASSISLTVALHMLNRGSLFPDRPAQEPVAAPRVTMGIWSPANQLKCHLFMSLHPTLNSEEGGKVSQGRWDLMGVVVLWGSVMLEELQDCMRLGTSPHLQGMFASTLSSPCKDD